MGVIIGDRLLIIGKSKSAKVLAVSEGTIFFDKPHRLSGFATTEPASRIMAGLGGGTIKSI